MNVLLLDASDPAETASTGVLAGLLAGLRARLPARFTVAARDPAGAALAYGLPAVASDDVVELAAAIGDADLVVCGGAHFTDGEASDLHPRLATLHVAARLGRPVVLYGVTVGPIRSALGRTATRNALDGCAWILAADRDSVEALHHLGVRAPVDLGAGGPLLGEEPASSGPAAGAVLGVSLPRGTDHGGAEESEAALVEALDAWHQLCGGTVWFLSDPTPAGAGAPDGGDAARRIAARIHGPSAVHAGDADPAAFRDQMARCELVLCAELSPLLQTIDAQVPVLSLGHHPTTADWLARVGLPGATVAPDARACLAERIIDAWHDRRASRAALAARLPALRELAELQLDHLAATATGLLPVAPRPPRAELGSGWERESWNHDRPHRALRVIADLARGFAPGPVLDLGSSTGRLGHMLGPAWDYTGWDIAASVASERRGFRVLTADVDTEWPLPQEARYSLVIASGVLEHVEGMGTVLDRVRERLRPDGVALLTLTNLAHFARGVGHDTRHPGWRFELRPDDWLLALRERGLEPIRVIPTTVGYGPPPDPTDEEPTDLERDGQGAPGLARALRLGHELIAVCRRSEPRLGGDAIEARLARGDTRGAIRIATRRARSHPWAARAWADLGVALFRAGRREAAADALLRAAALDPAHPGIRDDLAALGLRIQLSDPESAVLHDPEDADAWEGLRAQLEAEGLFHAAATVGALARAPLRRVA